MRKNRKIHRVKQSEVDNLYRYQMEKFGFIKFFLYEMKNYKKPNRWCVYQAHGEPKKLIQCSAQRTLHAHIGKTQAWEIAFSIVEFAR